MRIISALIVLGAILNLIEFLFFLAHKNKIEQNGWTSLLSFDIKEKLKKFIPGYGLVELFCNIRIMYVMSKQKKSQSKIILIYKIGNVERYYVEP